MKHLIRRTTLALIPFGISAFFIVGLLVFLNPNQRAIAAAGEDTCLVDIDMDGSPDFSGGDAGPVQDGIDAAGAGDEIWIAGDCTGINLKYGLTQTMFISKNLTIRGGYDPADFSFDPDTYTTTLDANRLGRVAVISGSVEVSLDHLVIKGGGGVIDMPGYSNDGAGIWTNAHLTLTNSSVISNHIASGSGQDGAGIQVIDGSAYIADTVIRDNTNADDDGGGMELDNSTVTIVRSQFIDNRTLNGSNTGGGISAQNDSHLTIVASFFIGNSTTGGSANAGALLMSGADAVTLTATTFDGNHTLGSSAAGGAINAIGGGVLLIQGGTFRNNSTAGSSALGGAIRSSISETHIRDSMFISNSTAGSDADGGAIYLASSSAWITATSILSNRAALASGAGVYNRGYLTVTNSTFMSNTATTELGGGLYNNAAGKVNVTNSTVTNNRADEAGGLSNLGTMAIYASSVNANIATGDDGGGILNTGILTITNSTISGNIGDDGAGIENSGDVWILNSTISGNIADSEGGGVENFNSGQVVISHSTIYANTGNGSEIFNGAQLTVSNSIIGNPFFTTSCKGPIEPFDGGYNLEIGTSCGFTATGSLSIVDAELGDLADNGGETWTHAPLNGSPAIDHIPDGINGCGSLYIEDQRGVVRPFNLACDVGAFEVDDYPVYLPIVVRP